MNHTPRIPALERDEWRRRLAAARSDSERLRLLKQLDERVLSAEC